MDWIEFSGDAPFTVMQAVQKDGRLSSQLANDSEIDHAAAELKRQVDVTARRMKMALQKSPKDPFQP